MPVLHFFLHIQYFRTWRRAEVIFIFSNAKPSGTIGALGVLCGDGI